MSAPLAGVILRGRALAGWRGQVWARWPAAHRHVRYP